MEIESYIEKQAITSHSHPTVVNDKNGVLSRFQVFMKKHFVSIRSGSLQPHMNLQKHDSDNDIIAVS